MESGLETESVVLELIQIGIQIFRKKSVYQYRLAPKMTKGSDTSSNWGATNQTDMPLSILVDRELMVEACMLSKLNDTRPP
jgi:hypothetical protein